MDIDLDDFWPESGVISHATICVSDIASEPMTVLVRSMLIGMG